jgi:O-succinylbenzoic acid--CoA ligase
VKSVWINGNSHLLEDYDKDAPKLEHLPEFEKEVLSFILEWRSDKETFKLKSSGSTGKPKELTLHRNQMIASAESTLEYLNITSGGRALLCLDPQYIGGKMVIVRSLAGNLDLYAYNPTANPLSEHEFDYSIDISSFVPYQVVEILKNPQSFSNFKKIDNVIIGGAAISKELEEKLSPLGNNIYHSFGMTETVSHIALKKLSGIDQSQYFKVLPGIDIGTDHRGCLTVKGKISQGETIITNDLVEIKNNDLFKWEGRIDQVINTGGIKININTLELKIRNILESKNFQNEFFIDHIPDEKLGQKIILILESRNSEIDPDQIKGIIKTQLTKFEIPKDIYVIKKFALTDSGKIDRRLIKKQISPK